MIQLWKQLLQEHAWLACGTAFTVALLIPTVALMLLDSRIVTGANPWLKPLKFEISIVVFNLTIAWLVTALKLPAPAATAISRTVAVAMLVEILAITIQAARGVPSHYNVTTVYNAMVFGSMAIAIVANTIAVLWLGILSFTPQPHLDSAVAWGVRLGLILFLLASLQGFRIVGNRGHTVGAADGGPGLPFLRWSTKAGDLRIAHFIGLHALQILPLLGYLTARHGGLAFVCAAFCLMTGFFFWTWKQAIAGRPLL
jgi:hypothetical protein